MTELYNVLIADKSTKEYQKIKEVWEKLWTDLEVVGRST